MDRRLGEELANWGMEGRVLVGEFKYLFITVPEKERQGEEYLDRWEKLRSRMEVYLSQPPVLVEKHKEEET